jgi:hypothetical protein
VRVGHRELAPDLVITVVAAPRKLADQGTREFLILDSRLIQVP